MKAGRPVRDSKAARSDDGGIVDVQYVRPSLKMSLSPPSCHKSGSRESMTPIISMGKQFWAIS